VILLAVDGMLHPAPGTLGPGTLAPSSIPSQKRIGGWLLVLSRLLIIGQPLYLALIASQSFNAIAVRGRPVVLVLLLRLAVTALGVAAGTALSNRRPFAVRLAQVAIVAAAAVHTFVLTTSYFPNNLKPGDTPIVLGAWLAFYGCWLAFLFRSRQAREICTS
jgi:hypothetical protein